jgi:hypothetical protein
VSLFKRSFFQQVTECCIMSTPHPIVRVCLTGGPCAGECSAAVSSRAFISQSCLVCFFRCALAMRLLCRAVGAPSTAGVTHSQANHQRCRSSRPRLRRVLKLCASLSFANIGTAQSHNAF